MIKKLAIAAAISAFSAYSYAAPTDLGSLVTTDDVVAADHFFTTNGKFTDTYTFSIGATGDLFGNALYFGSGSKYNITDFKAEVFGPSKASLGTLTIDTTAKLISNSVVSGDYSLVVSGSTFGASATKKPFYTFSLTLDPIAAVPVPEPETYAMFLAGLGIMGAVARRRSAKA